VTDPTTGSGGEDGAWGSVSAPAKLTLSLRVTGVRHDGYHLLDTELVSVDLVDTLTFGPGSGIDVVDEVVGGLGAAAVPTGPDNLVARALAAALARWAALTGRAALGWSAADGQPLTASPLAPFLAAAGFQRSDPGYRLASVRDDPADPAPPAEAAGEDA